MLEVDQGADGHCSWIYSYHCWLIYLGQRLMLLLLFTLFLYIVSWVLTNSSEALQSLRGAKEWQFRRVRHSRVYEYWVIFDTYSQFRSNHMSNTWTWYVISLVLQKLQSN